MLDTYSNDEYYMSSWKPRKPLAGKGDERKIYVEVDRETLYKLAAR
jgi:hypothetical protein